MWPKKLRRFNANDSVIRAKSREHERKYNCLTNNCEHFVVWCICGLKVSLQVKNWHTWPKELVKFLWFTTIECAVQWGIILLIPHPNVSEDVSLKILGQPENAAFAAGFAIILVVQLLLCFHEVRKAIAESRGQDFRTGHELDAALVDIIAKKWFQFHLGTAGVCFGLPYNTLGSVVGVFVGVVAGNRLGAITKWYFKNLENSLTGTIGVLFSLLTVIYSSIFSVSGVV